MNAIVQLIISFLKVGAFSFGGGYAIIPLLQREFVAHRRWLSPAQFVDVVAISQMTPGPVIINSATFIGFREAGFWGSAVATLAVSLPSVAIVWILAVIVRRQAHSNRLQGVLAALRPLVVALVVAAAWGLAREALPDGKSLLLALVTFVAATRFRLDPIALIAVSGLAGVLLF